MFNQKTHLYYSFKSKWCKLISKDGMIDFPTSKMAGSQNQKPLTKGLHWSIVPVFFQETCPYETQQMISGVIWRHLPAAESPGG